MRCLTEQSARPRPEPVEGHGVALAPHITVLVNPAAGKGRGEAAAELAVRRLRELGAQVTVLEGDSAESTRRHAAAAVRDRPDAIVVVGGDGTLSSILEEIAHAEVPIALVPAGTGNDFARAMGLPFGHHGSAAEAAALVLTGEATPVDVGSAHCPDGSAKFLTVAALGFDALVSERTNRLKWPKGALRYYLALLIELARLRPLHFNVRIDDESSSTLPGILAAVGNTRSYGGGMPMCPEADPSDGLFDLTLVGPLSRARLLRLFPLLLKAKHAGRSEVLTRRLERIEISAPGLIVYADGEKVGTESVRIDMLPGALRVFAPYPSTGSGGGGAGSGGGAHSTTQAKEPK